MAEGDAAARQIVRRKLNHDPVAWQHTDVIFPHSPAQVTKHLMTVLKLNLEHRVRQRFENLSFDGDRIRIRPARSFRWRRRGGCRGGSWWWSSLLWFLCQRACSSFTNVWWFPGDRVDQGRQSPMSADPVPGGARLNAEKEPMRLPRHSSHGISASRFKGANDTGRTISRSFYRIRAEICRTTGLTKSRRAVGVDDSVALRLPVHSQRARRCAASRGERIPGERCR